MSLSPYNYSIFFDFIESYLSSGFLSINADDPIMQQLEEVMEENDQFLSVMHMEQIRTLYTSKRSKQVLGVESSQLNPSHFQAAVHPDDLYRLAWANCQILREEGEIYQKKYGSGLMSYSLRFLNPSGNFTKYLVQDYLFYSEIRLPEVYAIRIVTNIEWCPLKNHCSHQYVGSNMSMFKFPDVPLLKITNEYSDRELNILRLIEKGLSSKEIAEKLFLSVHTVNTHRSNILKRSSKSTISELIYKLKKHGLL